MKIISPAAYDAASAREENIIGSRIAEARRSAGMSAGDLSDELLRRGVNVMRGGISKWELGQTVPGAYQLLALCDIFGIDDSLGYFTGRNRLNAEGMRRIADYKADLIAGGRYAPARPAAPIRYVDMPVSMLAASAGTGNFLDDDNFENLSFPEDTVPAGADFGVRVAGDSMEPVYSDGQIVWVKECAVLRPGEVGIFILDGEGYIKMYSEQGDASGEIRPVLISYNKAYSPITVGEERMLRVVGKVL